MVQRVYIGVGSNHEPLAHIRCGMAHLRHIATIITISPPYRTVALNGGSVYWNAAVCIETAQTPDALKAQLVRIESACGRVRYHADGSKSHVVALDLDILLYGPCCLTYGSNHIPHPDVLRYAHTIVPLAHIAPDVPHPETGERLQQIATRFAHVDVRMIANMDLWPDA